MPNEKPLEIHYFSTRGVYKFKFNRTQLNLDEVKKAPFVNKTKYWLDEEDSPNVGQIAYAVYPRDSKAPNLICTEIFDPYGFGDRSENKGNQGIGLHFELRVLRHIRDELGAGDAKIRHYTDMENRIKMLHSMGIAHNGASHTLDEHIELYAKRIKEIEARLKHG